MYVPVLTFTGPDMSVGVWSPATIVVLNPSSPDTVKSNSVSSPPEAVLNILIEPSFLTFSNVQITSEFFSTSNSTWPSPRSSNSTFQLTLMCIQSAGIVSQIE